MINKILVLCTAAALFLSCSSNKSYKITAAGVIDGNIIHVKANTAGTICRLNVTEAQRVSKGDTIVIIDLKKIENQMRGLDMQERSIRIKKTGLFKKREFLQERFEYLTSQVGKLKRLSKSDAVSEDNFKTARLKKKEAETALFNINEELKGLRVELEKLNNKKDYLTLVRDDHIVTAPCDGVILETFVLCGENVFPRDMIADLLDESSLFTEVFLEEEEINSLALGDSAEIRIDGQKYIKGVVTFFGQKAEFSPKYIISEKERKNLLYQVKVSINLRNSKKVKVGMPVTVVFKADKRG